MGERAEGQFSVKGSGKGVTVYGGGGGGMATGIFQTEQLQGQTKNGNSGERKLCRKGSIQRFEGLTFQRFKQIFAKDSSLLRPLPEPASC